MGSGSITINGKTTYFGTAKQAPVDSAVKDAVTVEKIYKDAKAEYDAQKWIGDNSSQPTDPIDGPRLWVAESFPRADYVKLWDSSGKLASEKGVHVAIRRPAFGIVEAEISVYDKKGAFIGNTIVSPFDEKSMSDGINILKRMIDGTYVDPKKAVPAEKPAPGVISEKFGAVKDKVSGLISDARSAVRISDADQKTDPQLEGYSEQQKREIVAKAKELATGELMKLQGADKNFDNFSVNAAAPQFYAQAKKELNY